MMPLLTIILVVFLVGFLIPKRPQGAGSEHGFSVKIPYFIFVVVLASSPVAGAVIGTLIDRADNNLGFLRYLWVGIALSLPLSLITARMFGKENLPSYWQYLGNFGYSRAVIIYSWAFATLVAIGSVIAVSFLT